MPTPLPLAVGGLWCLLCLTSLRLSLPAECSSARWPAIWETRKVTGSALACTCKAMRKQRVRLQNNGDHLVLSASHSLKQILSPPFEKGQFHRIGQVVNLLIKFWQIRHFSIFVARYGQLSHPRIAPRHTDSPLSCARALHSHHRHLSESRWREEEGQDLQAQPLLGGEEVMGGGLRLLLKLDLMRRESTKRVYDKGLLKHEMGGIRGLRQYSVCWKCSAGSCCSSVCLKASQSYFVEGWRHGKDMSVSIL